MKKKISSFGITIAVVLSAVLLLSLVSCSNGRGDMGETGQEDYQEGLGIENSKNDVENRKIIYEANMYVQTSKYDDYIKTLRENINRYGGYFSSYKEDAYSFRTTQIVIRIPADKYEDMKTAIGTFGTVISSEQTATDITMSYIDVQSRIESLKAQKESLDNMAKVATETHNLIEIQKALTDVIYELEKYEKQLLAYDDLISYSTINLSIDEVNIEQIKEGPFTRIGNNFVSSIISIWNGIVEIFVFIIGYLPYFIIIGGVTVGIVLIIKKKRK